MLNLKKFLFDLRKFSGVYPVYSNIFKVGTKGLASVEGDMAIISDLTTFSPAIDNTIDTWSPLDIEGWIKRAIVGKGLTINLSGKKNYSDAGNNYVSSLFLKSGDDAATIFEWILPNGDKLSMQVIISVKTPAGGDSSKVDSLEFEVLSNGKPTFTPAVSTLIDLSFVCVDGAVAGATKIASVLPALTAGNAYYYKINGALPSGGENITGKGWAPYTLGNDILTTIGNNITLVEATAGMLAVKGGFASVVIV